MTVRDFCSGACLCCCSLAVEVGLCLLSSWFDFQAGLVYLLRGSQTGLVLSLMRAVKQVRIGYDASQNTRRHAVSGQPCALVSQVCPVEEGEKAQCSISFLRSPVGEPGQVKADRKSANEAAHARAADPAKGQCKGVVVAERLFRAEFIYLTCQFVRASIPLQLNRGVQMWPSA